MLAEQFPAWAGLPLRPIEEGWDNRSFRLGEEFVVRLPSAAEYAGQVEKECRWLPVLAPRLPLEVPIPVGIGTPGCGYPWRWAIYKWIEGETAALERIGDIDAFARTLAAFLVSLRGIDPSGGPAPGSHNFHRGASLRVYDGQVRQAVAMLGGRIDGHAASETWKTGLRTEWSHDPAWLHGDVSPGNLLVRDGRLRAVIDFGGLAVGDPACDLSIAWTLFRGSARQVFLQHVEADEATRDRGRAWALWKALIVAADLVRTNAVEMKQPFLVIQEALAG